jgi:D-amino peptidase
LIPALLLFADASIAAAAGPKVYVSVDMEGIAGVVTGDQLSPQGFEYQRFREFMTNEALAAIEGARAAGASEFVGKPHLVPVIPRSGATRDLLPRIP